MTRVHPTTFGELAGKLTVLRMECAKCGRSGQYRIDRLIAERGKDATVMDLLDEATADCPRRKRINWSDRCAALCPDLPKVV